MASFGELSYCCPVLAFGEQGMCFFGCTLHGLGGRLHEMVGWKDRVSDSILCLLLGLESRSSEISQKAICWLDDQLSRA